MFWLRNDRRGSTGKKLGCSREEARKKHFVTRFRERIGIRLSDREYDMIEGNVRNGTHTIILDAKYTTTSHLIAVKFRTFWVPIIVKGNRIETVLQLEVLANYPDKFRGVE